MTHIRTRLITALVAVVATVPLLTGCSGAQLNGQPAGPNVSEGLSGIRSSYVPLPDGREVFCITSKQNSSGGISCDWEHATIATGKTTDREISGLKVGIVAEGERDIICVSYKQNKSGGVSCDW